MWIQQFELYTKAIQLNKKPADLQAAMLTDVLEPEAMYNYFSTKLKHKKRYQPNEKNLKITVVQRLMYLLKGSTYLRLC